MQLLLQESGGMRRTAPVQSPVPVAGGARLSPLQRALLFCFLAIMIVGQVMTALYATAVRPAESTVPSPPPGALPVGVE
jgi:hypothetical protein